MSIEALLASLKESIDANTEALNRAAGTASAAPAKEAAAAEGDGKGAIKSKAPAKDAPAGEPEGDGEDGEANDVV